MRGYRGFLRELARTGSLRALGLQLRTGALHVARQTLGRRPSDPVSQFFGTYGPDGVRAPEPAARALAKQAEACLVCGLCSLECARVGGTPPLDPRDAVVAAARLEVDWLRLGLSPGANGAGACSGCDACSRICPAGIPIHLVQTRLASLGARGNGDGGASASDPRSEPKASEAGASEPQSPRVS